jgi:hypothetical protein
MIAAVGTASLWIIMAWAALLLFFSPALFVIGVYLPELPILVVRRLHYIPFDSV